MRCLEGEAVKDIFLLYALLFIRVDDSHDIVRNLVLSDFDFWVVFSRQSLLEVFFNGLHVEDFIAAVIFKHFTNGSLSTQRSTKNDREVNLISKKFVELPSIPSDHISKFELLLRFRIKVELSQVVLNFYVRIIGSRIDQS